MKQLFLLLISFVYGYIFAIAHTLLNKIKLKKNIYLLIINFIFFLIFTLLYITLIYILNKGHIHLYMKLILILGFFISKYCKISVKKLKKQK